MGLRKILTNEEKALYKHCREVTNFDDRLHTLLDDMRDPLMQADGVGLAAPRTGTARALRSMALASLLAPSATSWTTWRASSSPHVQTAC